MFVSPIAFAQICTTSAIRRLVESRAAFCARKEEARPVARENVSRKPKKPRRRARSHIAFNSISCVCNVPALEKASKCFSPPLSSRPRTAILLCVYATVYLFLSIFSLSISQCRPSHRQSRLSARSFSLLLCFAITLARVAQSRLPNIHRLLILLTVCASNSKLRTTCQGKHAYTHTHNTYEAACSDNGV